MVAVTDIPSRADNAVYYQVQVVMRPIPTDPTPDIPTPVPTPVPKTPPVIINPTLNFDYFTSLSNKTKDNDTIPKPPPVYPPQAISINPQE